MLEYKDITLFEFPIQMPIEKMPVGAIFMSRVADGFFLVFLKCTENCVYSLYSIRRTG